MVCISNFNYVKKVAVILWLQGQKNVYKVVSIYVYILYKSI